MPTKSAAKASKRQVIRPRRGNFHSDFAFPLPLWPERVVAGKVSLSSVSSGCAKLFLVESGFPDLSFVTTSLGVA